MQKISSKVYLIVLLVLVATTTKATAAAAAACDANQCDYTGSVLVNGCLSCTIYCANACPGCIPCPSYGGVSCIVPTCYAGQCFNCNNCNFDQCVLDCNNGGGASCNYASVGPCCAIDQ